jgi:protein-S-isoprenylcysteine O-methyltransferase Ste14
VSAAIAGFFAPWIIYTLILALHLLLPARKVVGYVRDDQTGNVLEYRLNGPLVLVILVLLWVVTARTHVFAWDWLYSHRWSGLVGSAVLGLLVTLALVLPAPRTGRRFPADLYFGRSPNRQLLGARADVKMYLYLVGAAMLALNVLSFLAHHVLGHAGSVSPGAAMYAALFLWFIVDYLVFEKVHLYTYDIFAERVGFKLIWGCFTFYPYFYAVGLWAVANRPDPETPPWLLAIFTLVFFCGWFLSRGANLQKYFFKTRPERSFLGLIRPRTLVDGEHTLLASGFWAVSRHVNYLGEILMAAGLTLVLGHPGVWEAWLYPLYYVALLVPRERADERRCAAKYGALWTEYERVVPRRIVPWIY